HDGREGDLILQPGLSVLLRKRDAARTEIEGEQSVRFRRAYLRQLRREVDLRERRQLLADHLSLVGALQRIEDVVAGLEVKTHDVKAFDAALVQPGSHRE